MGSSLFFYKMRGILSTNPSPQVRSIISDSKLAKTLIACMQRQEVTSRSDRHVNEAHQDLMAPVRWRNMHTGRAACTKYCGGKKKGHGLDRKLVLGCADEENIPEVWCFWHLCAEHVRTSHCSCKEVVMCYIRHAPDDLTWKSGVRSAECGGRLGANVGETWEEPHSQVYQGYG